MANRKRGKNESYTAYRKSLKRLDWLLKMRLRGKQWRVRVAPSQRLDRLPGIRVRDRRPNPRSRVAVKLTGWEMWAYRMTNWENSQWLRDNKTPDDLMKSAEAYSVAAEAGWLL